MSSDDAQRWVDNPRKFAEDNSPELLAAVARVVESSGIEPEHAWAIVSDLIGKFEITKPSELVEALDSIIF